MARSRRWTDHDVAAMRAMLVCGRKYSQIARTFGTTRNAVAGLLWRHHIRCTDTRARYAQGARSAALVRRIRALSVGRDEAR